MSCIPLATVSLNEAVPERRFDAPLLVRTARRIVSFSSATSSSELVRSTKLRPASVVLKSEIRPFSKSSRVSGGSKKSSAACEVNVACRSHRHHVPFMVGASRHGERNSSVLPIVLIKSARSSGPRAFFSWWLMAVGANQNRLSEGSAASRIARTRSDSFASPGTQR